VRELRNCLEQMVIAADGGELSAEHLPSEFEAIPGEPADEAERRSFRWQRLEAERRILREALDRNDGKLTQTARELGLADHSSLSKLMRRLGIER
jgi:DNA-binding NtrC family response regulator